MRFRADVFFSRLSVALLAVQSGLVLGAPACFQPNTPPPYDLSTANKWTPVFEVWEHAAPPKANGDTRYLEYPLSRAVSTDVFRITRNVTSTLVGLEMWANHGPRRIAKSNPTPGVDKSVTVVFSSIDKANYCTLAQTAIAIGAQADASTFIAAGSLTATSDAPTSATTDVCFYPGQPTISSTGTPIVLDYEVGDGRSADQTSAFLSQWTSYLAGKGWTHTVLYPDPLDSNSTSKSSGITTANAPLIASYFEVVSIMLEGAARRPKNDVYYKTQPYDIAQSFYNQAHIYSGDSSVMPDPSKLMITFDLGRSSIYESQAVYGLMAQGMAKSLFLWRDYAPLGEQDCCSCTNQRLCNVTLGQLCPPPDPGGASATCSADYVCP